MTIDPSCWRLDTQAVHAGAEPCPATGARVTPIYQTNGFVFDELDHGADIFNLKRPGYAYSRGSNPTTAALERRIAALEGGTGAVAVASGQSALLLIIATLACRGRLCQREPHLRRLAVPVAAARPPLQRQGAMG